MAKKKMKIFHLHVAGNTKHLCGANNFNAIFTNQPLKELKSFAKANGGRLCHKCKHIHNLNRREVA
jgi:hypothetical protein